MGLFNFINYDKEGPGVSKNEPEKKSFVRFFELYFRNFWKLVTLSLYHMLISIPVVTSGLAAVGSANVTRNLSRGKHSFGAQDFFDTIKKNWKQGLGIGILNLVISALLIFDVWYFFGSEGTMSTIFVGISLFLLFVFTVMKYYMPLLIITFSLSAKQIYKNCFKFVFINLPRNLLILLVEIACAALAFVATLYGGNLGVALVSVLSIAVYPAFRAFLIQFVIFDCIRKYMIDPYYAEHPDADIEKRLDLGLDVPEEYMPKYEDDYGVFDDERVLPKSEEE